MHTTSVKLKEEYMRKTEHFKALTQIGPASAVADHSISTGHNFKWDHFEILAKCSLIIIVTVTSTNVVITHCRY